MRIITVVALLLVGSLMMQSEAQAIDSEPAVVAEATVLAKEATGTGEENKSDYVTREDLDALRDLLDEQIKRGVASKYTVNLSGFGIVGFNSNYDKPDSFGISSASLSLSGNLREDPVEEGDVKYKISLLFGGASPTALNSAKVGSGGGLITNSTTVQSPVLSDVILIWDLKTLKGELEPLYTLSATVGQQLVPFGQDNLATEDKIPTIRKAQYLGGYGISRDIGVKLDGGLINRHDPASGITTPLFAYSLAGFNGSGPNRNDDNSEKDFGGRVVVAPVKDYFSFFRDLKFGGSYYHGTRGQNGGVKTTRELFGAEFEWLKKPFLLTAEAVFGKDNKIHSTGFVSTLFWTPGTLPDFQPLFRFDSFDPDRNQKNDRADIYTVGFNYFFYQVEPITRRTYEIKPTERVAKLQVNWNLRKQEGRKLTANDVNVQFVYTF